MFTPRGGVLVPPTPSPQGRQLFQKIIATEIRAKTAFVTDELYVENVNIMSALSALQGGGGGTEELASLSAFTNNVLAVNLSSQSLSVYSVFGTTVALSGSVNTLSGSVNTLSGFVNTLSGSVNTLSGSVNTLSSSVNTISGSLEILSGSVNTLSGSLEILSGSVNTLSGSVNTLSGSVRTLSGSLDTLSTTVANLASSSGGFTVASIGGISETPSGFLAYYDYTNQIISAVESSDGVAALLSKPGLKVVELSASLGNGIRLRMSDQLTPSITGFTFAVRYAAPISEGPIIVMQLGKNPATGEGCVCFSNDHRVRTGLL